MKILSPEACPPHLLIKLGYTASPIPTSMSASSGYTRKIISYGDDNAPSNAEDGDIFAGMGAVVNSISDIDQTWLQVIAQSFHH